MKPISRSKVAGSILYRVVDSRGQTIDFRLSARRDAQAAKRFFRQALARSNTVSPRTITVDKNAAYPKAVADLKDPLTSYDGKGFGDDTRLL